MNESELKLLTEIGEQRQRAVRAEADAAMYREAFEFLLQQEDFAPLLVRLRKHLKKKKRDQG